MACEGRRPPPPVGAASEGLRNPSRAVVTPRACAAPDGEPLPLHDHVRRLLARGMTGVVNVFGGRGSGKTTALRHLADLLPPEAPVVLRDLAEPSRRITDADRRRCLVVLATCRRAVVPHLAAFRMAPWTNDDAIEYLLAKRPDRCASVMDRLKQSPTGATTQGLPRLWAIVLDEMIASDAIATPAEALRHHLAARLTDETVRHRASAYCLRQFMRPGPGPGENHAGPPAYLSREDRGLARLICHPPVQLLLAAQRVVWDLAGGKGRRLLHRPMPVDLLREVSSLAAFR